MQFGRSCQIKKISAEACGNICPWRNWITQQIPILEIGGSNPFGQATVKWECKSTPIFTAPVQNPKGFEAERKKNSPEDCF